MGLAARRSRNGYRLLRDISKRVSDTGGHMERGLDAPDLSSLSRLEPPGVCFDHGAATALVPASLLFGLLGGSADASVGRLRLAPRFPGAWQSFRVSNIHVGDARVSLDYERAGSEHTFRIRQERGRIPLMLVFEPEIAEREIVETRIGGRPVDLLVVPSRGRCPLACSSPESERVVTLVGARGERVPNEKRRRLAEKKSPGAPRGSRRSRRLGKGLLTLPVRWPVRRPARWRGSFPSWSMERRDRPP